MSPEKHPFQDSFSLILSFKCSICSLKLVRSRTLGYYTKGCHYYKHKLRQRWFAKTLILSISKSNFPYQFVRKQTLMLPTIGCWSDVTECNITYRCCRPHEFLYWVLTKISLFMAILQRPLNSTTLKGEALTHRLSKYWGNKLDLLASFPVSASLNLILATFDSIMHYPF